MSAGDFALAIQQIVQELGNTLTVTDTAGATRTMRGAVTTIGKEEAALVNSVGIEARIVYTRNEANPLQKFEMIRTVNGGQYTVLDVHMIELDNTIVGYKAVVKE